MEKLAFLPKKKWMLRALELAREAAAAGEVPVGAVVVLLAISQACRKLHSWRLTGCELYVTLEPCPMCTGALINAHIDTVVYGAEDERAGCCGTAADLFTLPYSHRPEVYRGFLEEEAKALLREFFNGLRH